MHIRQLIAPSKACFVTEIFISMVFEIYIDFMALLNNIELYMIKVTHLPVLAYSCLCSAHVRVTVLLLNAIPIRGLELPDFEDLLAESLVNPFSYSLNQALRDHLSHFFFRLEELTEAALLILEF